MSDLDEYVSLMANEGFSGSILVRRADTTLIEKGYGFSDRARNRRTSENTIWSLGSITKQFTAVAILKLEEEGELTLDDNIGLYLPALTADKSRLTIHQLLSHISGLPEYSGPDDELIGADELIDRVNSASFAFEPGTGFSYSNVGYSLLGIIIERVAGSSYDEFLSRAVFEPAGLTATGYHIPETPSLHHAVGYLRGGEPWGTVPERNAYTSGGPGWNLKANGGIVTTVRDYSAFHRILFRTDRLLKPESRSKLTAENVELPDVHLPYASKHSLYHGYGWITTEADNGLPIQLFGGSNDIFAAVSIYYPTLDLFVFIASNNVAKPADDLIPTLHEILTGDSYARPERASEADRGSFQGVYVFVGGVEDSILVEAVEDNNLNVTSLTGGAFTRISGDTVKPEISERLKSLVEDIIDSSQTGATFSPFLPEFPGRVSDRNDTGADSESDAADLNRIQQGFWEQLAHERGAFTDYLYWGAVHLDDVYIALAKINAASGSLFLMYVFRDGRLRQINIREKGWRMLLRPESANSYVENNTGQKYRFSRDSTGQVLLVIGSGNGVVARKITN